MFYQMRLYMVCLLSSWERRHNISTDAFRNTSHRSATCEALLKNEQTFVEGLTTLYTSLRAFSLPPAVVASLVRFLSGAIAYKTVAWLRRNFMTSNIRPSYVRISVELWCIFHWISVATSNLEQTMWAKSTLHLSVATPIIVVILTPRLKLSIKKKQWFVWFLFHVWYRK